MTTTIHPRQLQQVASLPQAGQDTRLLPDPVAPPGGATSRRSDSGLRDPLLPGSRLPGRPPRRSGLPALRHFSGAGFEVVLHEGTHRAGRVVPGTDRLCVVVADQGTSAPMADDLPVAAPAASTTVWAHADGSLSVRASWGPPALLVRGDKVVMLPEVPGTTGQAVLRPGDRLVVLSSAAYESAPQQIVRLLHEDPPGLARTEAGALLGVLLGQVPGGGGAVITRLASAGDAVDRRSSR